MYQRNGVPLTSKVKEISYFKKNVTELPSKKFIKNKLKETINI